MNKVNKILVIGVLSLAVMIPLTTWLAISNQDSRSSAASDTSQTVSQIQETVNGVCGAVSGTKVTSLPDVVDACATGAVNWMDREATDGDYNWDCFGSIDGTNVSCNAVK